MKIVFILKKDPDATINTILTQNEKESEIKVIDLREDQDYDALIESIETSDKVIVW